jgi:hypothetical protein
MHLGFSLIRRAEGRKDRHDLFSISYKEFAENRIFTV